MFALLNVTHMSDLFLNSLWMHCSSIETLNVETDVTLTPSHFYQQTYIEILEQSTIICREYDLQERGRIE